MNFNAFGTSRPGILNVWMKVLNVLAAVGVIEQLRLQAAAVAVAQVVAHWITEREVRSSIPTGTWALSISSLSYLYQSVVVPCGGATLLILTFQQK